MRDPEEACMPPYEEWSRVIEENLIANATPMTVGTLNDILSYFPVDAPVHVATPHGTYLFEVVLVRKSRADRAVPLLTVREIQREMA